jgi:hypothetical protein
METQIIKFIENRNGICKQKFLESSRHFCICANPFEGKTTLIKSIYNDTLSGVRILQTGSHPKNRKILTDLLINDLRYIQDIYKSQQINLFLDEVDDEYSLKNILKVANENCRICLVTNNKIHTDLLKYFECYTINPISIEDLCQLDFIAKEELQNIHLYSKVVNLYTLIELSNFYDNQKKLTLDSFNEKIIEIENKQKERDVLRKTVSKSVMTMQAFSPAIEQMRIINFK